MRTLRDFLLAETLLVEKDDGFEMPKGYTKIDARGRLSNQAREVLGLQLGQNLSGKGKLMAKDKEGAKDIRKEMGPSALPSDNPIQFWKKFFVKCTSKKLKEFLDFNEEEGDRVTIKLQGQWASIGGKGKTKSSMKVIKFWIFSIMEAYGITDPHEKVGVIQNLADQKIMVYKKP